MCTMMHLLVKWISDSEHGLLCIMPSFSCRKLEPHANLLRCSSHWTILRSSWALMVNSTPTRILKSLKRNHNSTLMIVTKICYKSLFKNMRTMQGMKEPLPCLEDTIDQERYKALRCRCCRELSKAGKWFLKLKLKRSQRPSPLQINSEKVYNNTLLLIQISIIIITSDKL